MPIVVLFVALLLGACEGSFVRPENLGRKVQIDKSYAARDACLARNASADGTKGIDPDAVAQAVAIACMPETDKLIAASDFSGDAKVASAIRQDTQFRALKYVMQARGQAIF